MKKILKKQPGLLSISFLLLLAACSATSVTAPDNITSSTFMATTDTPRPVPDPMPTCCINPQGPDPLGDPHGRLAQRSIYFDLDGYVIRDEFRPLVEAHGRYLYVHPERKIRIVGHTDERGAREYNLGLGQRRAETVAQALRLFGARDAQIETLSYGEEKPMDAGHNETAWAKNRRVDLMY